MHIEIYYLNRMLTKLLLGVILILITLSGLGQNAEVFTPDSVKKEIIAIKITGSLHLDGLLNEPEWRLAPASPRFIQVEPYQGQAPHQETDVKVLFNHQYLYFGIIAHDAEGKKAIRATDFKRDFDFRAHDLLNLAFDCFNDQRNAMVFATNAYGVQRDLLSFDDLYYDEDWNGLWKVRTNRTDSGWTAEIAIPWQTLRYPKITDSLQQWGLSIYRNRRLTNEITSFSPFPRIFSSLRMNYAGVLKNLQPPPPKTNIRFQPYVLSSFDRYRGFDSSYTPNATHVKVGGDIKWAINPNAVLDLTANTDFAQADADQQVNNISQFSVFFPEKRQFFLENASLFGLGIALNPDGSGGQMRVQPFFSRSIGLDSLGTPIPIDVGGRFVYRSLKTNYGAILMRQHASSNTPATNFFVGRFSENIGARSRIGGLVTIKDNAAGRNIVSTIDGFFRLGDSHSLYVLLMNSSNSHGSSNGLAGFAQYFYTTNHTKIWLTQTLVSKNFDPQMGFVSRKDVIGTTPGINWYYRGKLLPFKKILRAFEPGFLPEFYWKASTGDFIERTLPLFPLWLNFQNGAFLGYAIVPAYQHLLQPFEPLGITIPVGEYHFTNQQIWLSSDPSRVLSISGTYTWGQYYNGRLNTGDWKLQFAPIPHISITARFNRNHFMNVGEAKTSTTIDLYGLEGRLAINPRIQLIGFYQKNAANSAENYNLRISWEYQPLSYVYLVLNHAGFSNVQAKSQTEDHIIAKISYLRQL
jgi:hypothetical protein